MQAFRLINENDSKQKKSSYSGIRRCTKQGAYHFVSSKNEKRKEVQLVKRELLGNGYPSSVVQKIRKKLRKPEEPKVSKPDRIATSVIPYRRNISEDIEHNVNRHNIRLAFRATNTVRSKLMQLKDRRPKEQSNLIYKIRCRQCPATYARQSSRQLNQRLAENERKSRHRPKSTLELKTLERDSAIALHSIAEGHLIDFKKQLF